LHRARKELKEELITMVEDKFDEHQLPEDFSEKIVQEVIVSMVKMGEKKEGDEGSPTAPIVILQNKDDEKQLLPIWIGMFEALAIAMNMENNQPPRPMTHDLMANMLEELGAKIVRITITDLAEGTFYAKIAIQINGLLKEIDARPSDSIALALRTDSPIFVAKSVLNEGGVCPSDDFPGPKQPIKFISGELLKVQTDIIKKPLLSMFQIDPKFQEELSNGKLSDELRQELENNGISLLHNTTVSQKSANTWQIEGEDREYFVIKREENRLDFCSTVEQPKVE
jgi:bifunctional DNase/RNase